jgi:hypothetical protein
VSLSLCLHPSLLGDVPTATNSCATRIAGRVVFYVIRVVSKESRRLVRPATSCFYFCIMIYYTHLFIKKGKAIPVTGRGGLRIVRRLDNWLTDGGEFVSLTHQ